MTRCICPLSHNNPDCPIHGEAVVKTPPDKAVKPWGITIESARAHLPDDKKKWYVADKIIDELCDALEAANRKIESLEQMLGKKSFSDKQEKLTAAVEFTRLFNSNMKQEKEILSLKDRLAIAVERIETMVSEINYFKDIFPGLAMYPSTVFAEMDLTTLRDAEKME